MITRYDCFYYLAAPAVLPYLAYRWLRRGKYRHSARGMLGCELPRGEERERFRGGSVWIHAVSVGETVAAKSLAALLREMLPQLPLVVTTITETGQACARQTLTEADCVHYFPLDLSWNVRRFLDCFNPRVFVLMEGEIWPNSLVEAARRGARIVLVNGKLSEKSYRRYRFAGSLLRPAFDAIRVFCMQEESAAEKMRDLCGRPGDVYVTGNCKLDILPEPLCQEEADALRRRYRLGPARPTLVVGSTHGGEEETVLAAFGAAREFVPGLQMILSPRHPERFEEVVALCRRDPGGWKVSRATQPDVDCPDILVLDTMGDLARAYGLGDVAVVAGSFRADVGGHNLLEAAIHSIPVIVGPHMHSQKEIDRLFRGSDSGCVRCGPDTLAPLLVDLFKDSERRERLGARALETARRNQGSARAAIDVIRSYLVDDPRLMAAKSRK